MNTLRDHRQQRLLQNENLLLHEDQDEETLHLAQAMLLHLVLEYLASQSPFQQWLQDSYPDLMSLLQTDENTSD
jgi:hypothetical protein